MNNLSYITVKQLAELVPISTKTIYKWAREGKLPCYKLNGTLLFDTEEISQVITANKIKGIIPSNQAKFLIGKNLVRGHNRFDSGQETFRK